MIYGDPTRSLLLVVPIILSVVDDFSRGVWIYMMKEKREAGKLLKNFIVMVKTQFDKVVKVLRSDNGLEFKSGTM